MLPAEVMSTTAPLMTMTFPQVINKPLTNIYIVIRLNIVNKM
ncbi:hypothetical protein JCM19231_4417 [Vibrio ishigakensis]|uniref:Uncharacterized protein n=1 Tax=Vibrio ishigakensis TaxID=1481914 RepID=A0A0B8NQI2_9VIBR|nr:hypothetical protein JCM19231_4417 [Vibrio ishigakensis]GAM72079.1 hypothetical protein JCM19236_776 [Vibrio sp. JCM 19236]